MAAKLPWFERAFNFNYPLGLFPDIIERLRGTPARVEEKLRGIPSEILTRREQTGWSIQENLGHLLTMEPLWAGRVDDFLENKPVLRAADLSNTATTQAGFNGQPVRQVLEGFRRERTRLVARLECLSDSDFARTSLHPRLNQPMRLVDAACFVACHDDYHLARMSELMRMFGSSG